jgi:hypothetical protein
MLAGSEGLGGHLFDDPLIINITGISAQAVSSFRAVWILALSSVRGSTRKASAWPRLGLF